MHKEDTGMELPPLPIDTKDQDLDQLRLMSSRVGVPDAWNGVALTMVMKVFFCFIFVIIVYKEESIYVKSSQKNTHLVLFASISPPEKI